MYNGNTRVSYILMKNAVIDKLHADVLHAGIMHVYILHASTLHVYIHVGLYTLLDNTCILCMA